MQSDRSVLAVSLAARSAACRRAVITDADLDLAYGAIGCTLAEDMQGPSKSDGRDDALRVRRAAPLGRLTTLELGGVAECLVEIDSPDTARQAVAWARDQGHPCAVLAGGSNVVIADSGFAGAVLHVTLEGITVVGDGDHAVIAAAAGESWDRLVELAVDEDLAGIECLSGIPGSVGATPIQNVGAYGQQVADVIDSVRVLDLETLRERELAAEECGFAYRTSIFRSHPGRFLVLEVRLRLRPGGSPTLAYADLSDLVGAGAASPSLGEVREAVLELRRRKSMVIDADDPNRRSVGSFFVNPVVDAACLERIARAAGVDVAHYPVDDRGFKVAAAWLIEQAGFRRGLRRGAVGLSSAHALALVHHGGGTTTELLALAREIRDGVRQRFGIELQPEPVFVGFDCPNPLD